MKAIEIQGLWKKFRLYKRKHATFKEMLIKRSKGVYEDFWALKDVNLSVNKGECLGVMGVNGAGKTTLFKVISRILVPTRGTVKTSGRISTVLDLGVGFHPDFTGIENIFTYGAILGLKSKDIEKNLDDIIEFSGIEGFLEQPLRSYSTGMVARLGFSVAVHISPDILLLDEVLAVGDTGFQKKCLEKLEEIKERGTTILMISHSPDQMMRLCPKSIIIKDHELYRIGETAEIVEVYKQIADAHGPPPPREILWESTDY